MEPFKSSNETEENFRQRTFYHGIESTLDLLSIQRQGFRREFIEDGERWFRDGNLGIGVYLSCNWKTALWFGQVLVRVTVQKGTHIFDTSPPADRTVLDNLVKKFGREVLTVVDPRKVIPRNKTLHLDEFGALLRHHYHETWHKFDLREEARTRDWSVERYRHSKATHVYASLLRRYGFHGFGNPGDDNGVIIFEPHRIILEEVLVDVPLFEYGKISNLVTLTRACMQDLQKRFPPRARTN